MTRNILRESRGIEFASGPIPVASKALGFLEDVIWNGNGNLHTISITTMSESVKAALRIERRANDRVVCRRLPSLRLSFTASLERGMIEDR